jgi:hypothetical protein
MVDDMRWILMIVLRGRVMGQSLPRWPFSKALNVGELYIRRVIRTLIHRVDYLYVYVCSSIALLYNIYYKVITIDDVILCEDTRINGGMGGIRF